MKRISIVIVVISILLFSGCIQPDLDEDFRDFQNLPGAFKHSVFLDALESREYPDRMYYNIFNELNWPGTRPSIECIANKETAECLYIHSILNSNLDLCEKFPEQKEALSCGSPGCRNVTVYYRDSCKAYTRAYAHYAGAQDKLAFCNAFEEDYITRSCIIYTCGSEFLDKPAACENIDINDYI